MTHCGLRPEAAPAVADVLRAAANAELVEALATGRVVVAASCEPDALATLNDAGLVEVDGDDVRPLGRVRPWDDLLIAADPDRPEEINSETVLGTNNTTRTLAQLTPRRRRRRALDLATGPGGPALLLANQCDTVIATDLSERAAGYARFNAAMNGVDVDVRTGDLFDPVAGEEPFDLITANLPFVVGPDTAYTFRDGGRGADAVSRDALLGAAERLAPDGLAVMLCSWIVPADVEPAAVVHGWLADGGCTVVVLHHSTTDPEGYARRWNDFLLATDTAAYLDAVDRWTTAYRDWGAVGIATGAVVLHRPDDGPAAMAAAAMTVPPTGRGGDQVERIVVNAEWLAAEPDDESLLATRFALVAGHRLDQAMRYDGEWTVADARMVLDDTAGVVGAVDPAAIHVLLRIDGQRPLAELVTEATEVTGLDPSDVRAAALATIRGLLAAGCLIVHPGDRGSDPLSSSSVGVEGVGEDAGHGVAL